MIYTCTTNPSLDYYLTLEDDIKAGDVTRSVYETYECGGKGVNVSIILSNLNIPSVTLGFLGGFTKDYYISFLTKYPFIQPNFTTVSGATRINIKLMGNKETSVNAKGPKITDEEFNKLKTRANRIFNDDIFVLSGNIQDEIQDNVEELVRELNEDGVKTILDCSYEVIEKIIDIKPFLVNYTYAINDDDDEAAIKNKMLEANNKGIKNVLVCKRNRPSYICFDQKVYKCDASNHNDFIPGYTDSFIGGFIFTIVRGGNCLEAFKYGQSTSLATSLSTEKDARKKLEDISQTIEIDEL